MLTRPRLRGCREKQPDVVKAVRVTEADRVKGVVVGVGGAEQGVKEIFR
jgi:hypothetical protein